MKQLHWHRPLTASRMDIGCDGDYTVAVEDIQNRVEIQLMQYAPLVAKAFILYRAQHTKERALRENIVQKVWEKTDATKVENANANVDERSFGGRKNEAASIIQKEMALELNMPQLL